MSNDGGLIATLEASFVATLAALEYDSELVFPAGSTGVKRVDHWRHQVGAISGGTDVFIGYTPFAFVGYTGADSAREGGHDLREILTISILIGTYNDSPGVARIGDADHLGVSKLRDLVIAAFESKTPSGDLGCDEIYYVGERVAVNSDKRFAIEMAFEVSKMTPPT
jgi:hypothetical protein